MNPIKRWFRKPMWERVPEGFASRDPALKGWNVEAVVALQEANWGPWLEALKGNGPLDLNFEARGVQPGGLGIHNTHMAWAYVAALAASGKARLSLLDWGGGLGHYAPLTRALLPGVELDYSCKDLPLFCAAGRRLQPQARFFGSDAEAFSGSYDLVLASSSLWYEENWEAALKGLASCAKERLYVTRQLVVEEGPGFVAVQRPEAFGYPTQYLCWVLGRRGLLEAAEGLGLRLEREFLIHPGPEIAGAPAPADYRGFLFRKGA